MTQAVHQGPRADVPESTQYLLGRAYAAALELDPDGDPAAVAFRVRIALRIVDRIESTCGWTDPVGEGFRAGAVFDSLGDVDAGLFGRARVA
jgi:hypothetical protein